MRGSGFEGAALYASGLRCEGVNLFLADGEAAGQEVFHVHLHVIPRFEGDGFGLTFGPDYADGSDRERLERTAERIRDAL
jgi:histidine triad (HIT) family protein